MSLYTDMYQQIHDVIIFCETNQHLNGAKELLCELSNKYLPGSEYTIGQDLFIEQSGAKEQVLREITSLGQVKRGRYYLLRKVLSPQADQKLVLYFINDYSKRELGYIVVHMFSNYEVSRKDIAHYLDNILKIPSWLS